jgi:hypothetical protein
MQPDAKTAPNQNANPDQLRDAAGAYRTDACSSPYEPMIDELYRQEVLEARRMSPEDKLILGERLFRWACAITLEGIRFQNPDATDDECQRALRERIELGKRLETL